MPASKQPIFREEAIKRYQQRQEQGILLRVSYPPALILVWIFLPLFLIGGGFAWSIQVPIRIQSQGVIIEQNMAGQIRTEVMAVLFFSPNQLTGLHVGQPAIVSIGSMPIKVSGSVESMGITIISPNEARSRFNLQGGLAQVIIGPSVAVAISLGPAASDRILAGSLCAAQIQTGTQSVLSLFPGFNHLV